MSYTVGKGKFVLVPKL